MKIKHTLLLSMILSIPSAFAADGAFTWMGAIVHALHLPIPHYVLTFIFISLMLTVIGFLYRAKINNTSNVIIPDAGITLRNLVELYGSFIYSQCKNVIGEEHADEYFPFISTVFIFIFICNFSGLIPGFLPPTEYLNTTLALGAFSFIYYNIQGCRKQGTINYLKHFCGPLWYLAFLIFPIEIISNLVRPLSLALRLRFNMFADHIVLSESFGIIPVLLPVVFMFLGLLVSVVQAYVFTVLTMVYIHLAVAHHDHDEEHAH